MSGNVLQFNGTSLTINGGINLTGFIEDWSSTTAPILRYFTNNGSLSIPNDAHFGDDGKTNYAAFVNTGTITAGAEYINSDYSRVGGSQSATVGIPSGDHLRQGGKWQHQRQPGRSIYRRHIEAKSCHDIIDCRTVDFRGDRFAFRTPVDLPAMY